MDFHTPNAVIVMVSESSVWPELHHHHRDAISSFILRASGEKQVSYLIALLVMLLEDGMLLQLMILWTKHWLKPHLIFDYNMTCCCRVATKAPPVTIHLDTGGWTRGLEQDP
jgi:hypothetical protein